MSTTSNNTETTKELEKFGSKLKAIRESKGLSIDDAHNAIRINKRVLIAFEENRFDESIDDYDNSVYLRAYLSKYCTYLGLQPYAFEAYGIYPKTKSKVSEVNKIGAGSVKASSRQNIYTSQGASKIKTIGFLILTVIIIASLGYVLLRSTGFFDKVETQPQTRVETLQDNSKSSETTTYSPSKAIADSNNSTNVNDAKNDNISSDTDKETVVENNDNDGKVDNAVENEETTTLPGIPPKGLYLIGKGDCWIGVKSSMSGKYSSQFTLKNKQDRLIDKNGIVHIGAPYAVDVYFNGQKVNVATDKGKVLLEITNGKLNVIYK